VNAERLLEEFGRVSEAPDAISRLREFIRDLAIEGQLLDLPARAELACVQDVAVCRLGKMLDKAKNRGTMRRYLRNVNVRWQDFDLSDVKEMRFEEEELGEFALRAGDVLVCEGGEPGRAAVWDRREEGILFQKAIHRVRLSDAVDPHFFVLSLRQAADSGRLQEYFTGATFKHLTGTGIGRFSFPLPPLAEQQRIVAKVDELMAVCDQLEAHCP
jgi:type I restriction enzyme, S subunit